MAEDRDPGDEHHYPRPHSMTACPECGCPAEPEPTDEERAKIFADPDFHWSAPDGTYLAFGFGLMGGGFGAYVMCERCNFFHKEQSGE